MSPLALRVVTATVLIALLALAFWQLDDTGIAALFCAILGVAAWEWSALAGLSGSAYRFAYAMATTALCALIFSYASAATALGIAMAGVAWWLYAAAALVVMQQRGIPPRAGIPSRLLAGWLVMVPALLSLLMIHARGLAWLAAMFMIIWAADTAAYFGGRRFGRTALASRISPGKTREGAYAGLAAVLALALVFVIVTGRDAVNASLLVALALVVGLASIVGDLYESVCKRQAGCKDSGTILPGHGGILDRIDSVLAAAPVFMVGIHALGGGGTG